MRNELAEIEECCRGIIDDANGLLSWSWDDYIGTMLAVFTIDQKAGVVDILDRYFTSTWDHVSIAKAPHSVRALANSMDGIRKTQFLFVTRPEQDIMAYGAWWPWGDEQSISIRIGMVIKNVPEHDTTVLLHEFREWFLQEA